MKSYTITVNGNVYDVTVEENIDGAPAAPVAAPKAAPAPAKKAAPKSAGGAGSVKITAAAAGKVIDVVASPGQAVKAGDPVVVLEVMKMETPVVAAQDGTIVSIDVSKGDAIETGGLIATMD